MNVIQKNHELIKKSNFCLKVALKVIQDMINERNKENKGVNKKDQEIIDFLLVFEEENALIHFERNNKEFFFTLSQKILQIPEFQDPRVNDNKFVNGGYQYVIHKFPSDIFPNLVSVILKLTKAERYYASFLGKMDECIREKLLLRKKALSTEDLDNNEKILAILRKNDELYMKQIMKESRLSRLKVRKCLKILLTENKVVNTKTVGNAKFFSLKNQ